MSGKPFNLDQVEELALRLSFRIGQINAWGLPWQRKDQALITEARDMLMAINHHVRVNGKPIEDK